MIQKLKCYFGLHSSKKSKTSHICCDGECNHDDCCGKVEANCPLALQDNK